MAATVAAKQPNIIIILADDPLETTNIVNRHPEVVEQLTKQLHEMITRGRSTSGNPQKNAGDTWTPDL